MSIKVERPTMTAKQEQDMRVMSVEEGKVEAQALYTAVMTDTYLDEDEEQTEEVDE